MRQTIRLHASAPEKPEPGAACNGCGVCCAAEPCPAGLLVFRRRHGPCGALEWDDGARRYRCGLADAPEKYLGWLPRLAAPLARRWLHRMIAAGRGCDSDATPC